MYLYPIGTTQACIAAANLLGRHGVALIDHPSPEVTHLLLDVSSFRKDGELRGGGDLKSILRMLPPDICIIGGNLQQPLPESCKKIDLLQDAGYLAKNAAITADCALRLAGKSLQQTFADSPTLVIGWGRIGKCLSQLLKQVGCPVTVAARKETDLALAEALGFRSVPISRIQDCLAEFSLVFNTVPAPVLDAPLPRDCLAFELASRPGIVSEAVISANGLPGLYAPKTSGRLIADSILKAIREDMP